MLTINLTDVVGSSGDIGYIPYIVANDKLGNSVLRQSGTKVINSGSYTSADGKTVLTILNGTAQIGYYNAVGESFVTADQTNLAGGYNNVATGENIYFFFDAAGFLVTSTTLPVNINTTVFNFNGSQVAVMSDLSSFITSADVPFGTTAGTYAEGDDSRFNTFDIMAGSLTVFSPSDSTTTYIGLSTPLAPNATDTNRQFQGIDGTIESAIIYVDPTSAVGSNENVTYALWNITDAVSVGDLGTITYDRRGNNIRYTGLSLAMVSTKLYSIRITNPAFGTNPTNCYTTVRLKGKV